MGTDYGDEEEEENRKRKGKFVSKSDRSSSVPAPLDVDRNAEDDEEYSVKESLEDETDEGCRRQRDHLQ